MYKGHDVKMSNTQHVQHTTCPNLVLHTKVMMYQMYNNCNITMLRCTTCITPLNKHNLDKSQRCRTCRTIDNYLQHVTTNTQIVWPISQLLNRSMVFTILLSLPLFSALHCFLIHIITDFQFGIGNFWIQMLTWLAKFTCDFLRFLLTIHEICDEY